MNGKLTMFGGRGKTKTMEVIKTEKQIKEIEVIIESYNLCDKCNERITKGYYDAFSFELEYVTGDTYPDGSDTKTQTIELCKTCAEDCMKLLKENGYRINETESFW